MAQPPKAQVAVEEQAIGGPPQDYADPCRRDLRCKAQVLSVSCDAGVSTAELVVCEIERCCITAA
ncbi:hypothetical protein GOODEAATRI_032494, partial [Goodea atripinnis]